MFQSIIEIQYRALLKGQRKLHRLILCVGRHDLICSLGMTTAFLTPLLAEPVAAQVGVSDAGHVVCAGTVNLAQLITVGLGLLSMYFILKGMVRMMAGLDNAGAIRLRVTEDEEEAYDTPHQYGHRRARGGVYSWVAAVLPAIVPVFLKVAGIDVVACLFP